MSEQLEQLYQQAKSALRGRDYMRASDLLRQILVIDENYKDTSRLLAQMVKLRRRRWYGVRRIAGGRLAGWQTCPWRSWPRSWGVLCRRGSTG